MENSDSSVECAGCHSHLSYRVLIDRKDYEYGVNYRLNYYRCSHCDLVFAYPLPDEETISTFYNNYTTHASNVDIPPRSFIINTLRVHYNTSIEKIFNNVDRGKVSVLDFGCGNGNFIKLLNTFKIKNVIGYDMDPNACAFAKEEGFNVSNNIDDILNCKFDFIFLNHVIEHLPEPINYIKQIEQCLNEGGKIVLRTPNSNSILAKLFKTNWRGWETPRHLQIFNASNIAKLFSKDSVIDIKTSNALFAGIFNESFHSNFIRKTIIGRALRKILFFILLPITLILNLIIGAVGEEICVIYRKN